MQYNTDTIQMELARLLPLSMVNEVACFVFYDNHPQDVKCIDITICTKNGEIKEYFQRDLVSSIRMKVSSPPTDIMIMRNSASELFYIIGTKDELFIVSSNERTLHLFKKISEVDSFAVDDWGGEGQAYLKVLKQDDAVPIFFDENFQSTESLYDANFKEDSVPTFCELKRKYIEAQHSVNNHEKSIREYIKLRHAATLCAYQDIHPNEKDALFKSSSNIYGSLKVKTQMPWVKVCNTKLIVALSVLNDYKEPIKEIQILLTSSMMISIVYSTKVFTKTNTLPFWKEDPSTIKPNSQAAVVAVMMLNELQPTVTDQVLVQGALSYKVREKIYLMPLDEVVISSKMTYGDAFDAMSSNAFDADTMLAILSTTQKTDLKIRLLTPRQTLIDLLTQYLEMERIGPDLVLYKKSPYHVLNGALLHVTGGSEQSVTALAYTRTKSQLLSFIQCINGMVPAKIIITPANYAIHTEIPSLVKFSEPTLSPAEVDYLGYAKTIVNRTTMILEYLDYSMVKMGESKDRNVLGQIGFKIDLYGGGKSSYKEFRKKMLDEKKRGVECWMKVKTDEPMAVD